MSQIQNLLQFTEILQNIKLSLDYYNNNFENEYFQPRKRESSEESFQRGEILFNQCDENLKNITKIIEQEEQINNFFTICKHNKQKLIEQKNDLINQLLRIKKNDENISKEEYLNYKNEWNNKREETIDERNRRECQELLEEMKNEKMIIEEMKKELENIIEKAKKEKKHNSIKEEFKKLSIDFVKKSDIPETFREEKFNLNTKQMKQLEDWTKSKCQTVLFDSDIDNWATNSSVFNEKIIGKSKLTFLIEYEEGEKFGYYLNTEVIEEYKNWTKTDMKSFHFNLESNGRLKEPMKFEILNVEYGGYHLIDKSDWNGNLIRLGDIILVKQNWKNSSWCIQNNHGFNYHEIEKALCGKEEYEMQRMFFKLKRLIVIQMK